MNGPREIAMAQRKEPSWARPWEPSWTCASTSGAACATASTPKKGISFVYGTSGEAGARLRDALGEPLEKLEVTTTGTHLEIGDPNGLRYHIERSVLPPVRELEEALVFCSETQPLEFVCLDKRRKTVFRVKAIGNGSAVLIMQRLEGGTEVGVLNFEVIEFEGMREFGAKLLQAVRRLKEQD